MSVKVRFEWRTQGDAMRGCEVVFPDEVALDGVPRIGETVVIDGASLTVHHVFWYTDGRAPLLRMK